MSSEELGRVLENTVLPPFVLVWRDGWVDWLPAYLVAELQGSLGARELCAPASPVTEAGHTRPPPPPLEWYLECLGDDADRRTLLEEEPASRPSLLELDWMDFEVGSKQFSPFEAPTQPFARRSLPAAAFRDADAYLSQFRSSARKSRSG